jgi:serpin B
MKMKIIGITLIILTLGSSCERTANEDPVFEYNKKSAEVIQTNNHFGLNLFSNIIASEEKANVMISPTSISLAMGMAYNGAETSTKEAFDSVLNYEGLTRAEVNEITRDLIKTLVTNSKGNLLEIANSVWYRTNFPVFESFIEMNKTYYGAEVKELDFADPAAVDAINSWVADKTHDKIDKIIEELPPESMMLLINALYFNCLWEIEFDADETKTEPFYNEDQTTFGDVDMMTTEEKFNYAATDNYTAVELPYKNGKFSMHLFLPSNGTSLDELIDKLDGESWNEWIEAFSEHEKVQVTIPKFKFDYQRSLGDDLSGMGLGVAFTEDADFSGISEIDLLISKVIHKTYIDVNEEGTEAAAVTAVEIGVTSIGPGGGPVIIRLDRPFLFAITENSSKSIVFIGKMMEPEYK